MVRVLIIYSAINILYLLSGNPLIAGEREIDSLKLELHNPQNGNVVQTLNELAWEYMYDSLDSAHVYAQQAIELSNQDLGELQDYGDARMRLGSVYVLQNDPEKAIPYFKEAAAVRTQLLDQAPEDEKLQRLGQLAGAYDNLTIAQDMSWDYEESAKSNAIAVSLLAPYADNPQIALILVTFMNNRANSLQQKKDWEKAMMICDSAQQMLAGLGEIGEVQLGRSLLIEAQVNIDIDQCDIAKLRLKEAAQLLTQIDAQQYFILQLAVKEGIVARCEGRVPEALSKWRGIYPQAEELKQTDILLTINSQLIEIFTLLGEGDSVRKYLHKQQVLYSSIVNTSLQVENYLRIIELELEDKDTTAAKEAFVELDKIWSENVPPNYKNRYVSLKSKYYQLVGNYLEAYQYARSSQKIKDTLFEITSKAKKYDRVRVENDRIRTEQETQRRIDFLIMLSLAIVVILLALSILFMRRSYKERNRALGAKIKEEEAIQQQTRLEQKVDTLIKENEISSLNSLLQGQEKERERIGRELHDGVVATLSTVKLYINGVNDQMNLVAKETNSKIMAANQLIDSALEEVRSISHNLSKGMLAKLGLRDALQNFGDTIQNAGQAEIDIKVHDMDERYYVETELMIYRNIQELVGNAIKHGGAKKIEVGITRHDDIINVTVQDDGGGFDYEEIKSRREGGIGLFNMERAVTTLGGTFHVDSSQGVGTTIIMDIPIKNQKESAQS